MKMKVAMAVRTLGFAVLLHSMVLPSSTRAGVFEDLVVACLAAAESGDTKAFEDFSGQLRKRKDAFDTKARDTAEDCLSIGYGEPWVFDFPTDTFMSAAAVDARQKVSEDAKRRTALADAQKRGEDAAKEIDRQLNAERVSSMVYAACLTLFDRDIVEAMTNALCVESFLANGAPELPEIGPLPTLLPPG